MDALFVHSNFCYVFVIRYREKTDGTNSLFSPMTLAAADPSQLYGMQSGHWTPAHSPLARRRRPLFSGAG